MLFLTKRRVLCTHILEAYIFKDFNNRKIPLNINPLNYMIFVSPSYPKTVESGAGNSLDLLVHAVRWRIKIIPMVR